MREISSTNLTVLGLSKETTKKINPATPIAIPTISLGIPMKNVRRITGNNTREDSDIPDFFLPLVILMEIDRIANIPRTDNANRGIAESTGFLDGS